MGPRLYERIFKHYTKKQWDKYPVELDASVLMRLPCRTSTDDRYFGDEWQALPVRGYTRIFENMLLQARSLSHHCPNHHHPLSPTTLCHPPTTFPSLPPTITLSRLPSNHLTSTHHPPTTCHRFIDLPRPPPYHHSLITLHHPTTPTTLPPPSESRPLSLVV